MTITIGLQDVEYYAYHGYYEEEQKMGNRFVVNTEIELSSLVMTTEDINTTVNYEDLYIICKTEMDKPQRLLETVASNILNQYQLKFQHIKSAYIKINKLQPQLGGKLHSSFVALKI